MNSVREASKSRRRAKALNNPGGHAKDAEKGRAVIETGRLNTRVNVRSVEEVFGAKDMKQFGEMDENHPYFRRS